MSSLFRKRFRFHPLSEMFYVVVQYTQIHIWLKQKFQKPFTLCVIQSDILYSVLFHLRKTSGGSL